MHSFTTERLLIRPLIKEDQAFYIYQYTDTKMMRIIGKTMTQEQANKAFHRALKANCRAKTSVLTWAIVNKSTDEIIGTQALSWQKPTLVTKACSNDIEQVEIGIMLATKANGRLLPEEAGGALIEYAFNYLKIDRVNAFYVNKNLATKRILYKLGFVFEAGLQDINSNYIYQYCDKVQWYKYIITEVIAKSVAKEITKHADKAIT